MHIYLNGFNWTSSTVSPDFTEMIQQTGQDQACLMLSIVRNHPRSCWRRCSSGAGVLPGDLAKGRVAAKGPLVKGEIELRASLQEVT